MLMEGDEGRWGSRSVFCKYFWGNAFESDVQKFEIWREFAERPVQNKNGVRRQITV